MGATKLGPVVRRALAALEPGEHDEAAAALAQRYADLMDEAAPASKYKESLDALEALVARDGALRHEKALGIVSVALGEHSVASDLGPKLLAVLQQLCMTPAARQEKGAKPNAAKPITALDELKARRVARKSGA